MTKTEAVFTTGQAVQITRGTDRGAKGTIWKVRQGQVTLYFFEPAPGQRMNTQAPILKASSLKAI